MGALLVKHPAVPDPSRNTLPALHHVEWTKLSPPSICHLRSQPSPAGASANTTPGLPISGSVFTFDYKE